VGAAGRSATGRPAVEHLRQLASLRNVPFLIWNAASDELVPYPGVVQQANGFDSLGYRYEFDTFAPGEHLTLAVHDQYAPAAAFLGDARVNRNPAHVTYVRNPKMDFGTCRRSPTTPTGCPGLGCATPLAARRSAPSTRARRARHRRPEPGATQRGSGTLSGGNLGSLGYTSQSKAWGATPKAAKADVLNLDAKNIGARHRAPGARAARLRRDAQGQDRRARDGHARRLRPLGDVRQERDLALRRGVGARRSVGAAAQARAADQAPAAPDPRHDLPRCCAARRSCAATSRTPGARGRRTSSASPRAGCGAASTGSASPLSKRGTKTRRFTLAAQRL
jgi:hypothetical protein